MYKFSLALLLAMLTCTSILQAQDRSITESKSPVIEPLDKEEVKAYWKKAYFAKLRKVSPRVSYGIGNFEASMRYKVPDVQQILAETANDLDSKYRWIPWNKIDVEPADPFRTKTLKKSGNFFLTTGLNLPIFFVDVEAGVGRFSEPLLTVSEVFPIRESVSSEGFGKLMLKRVTTPTTKGSVNLRVGVELERVLPDHLLPRLKFGMFAAGIDVGAYYLIGADFSYRAGFEVLGEEILGKIENALAPVPIISAQAKKDAANAILGHMESRTPAYLWVPAFQGYGLKGQVYFDIGQGLRIAGTYTQEKSFGLQLKGTDWLKQGPQIWRNFFTLGIESKL